MNLRTIAWVRNAIRIIDQTRLPAELRYVRITDLRSLWHAIKILQVRGAPALGAAAGLGVYLGIKDSRARKAGELFRQMDRVIRYLGSARPTARNLFWGLERMASVAVANRGESVPQIKRLLFREAMEIIEEDRRTCRSIGEFGSTLIKNGASVLTVCNAGILATIDYGTALGVLYRAKEKGRRFRLFACETRPLLQGARLTTWELKQKGIDVTLLCDNMAASLMARGAVDAVITGADRIAANGDTANKIGTYSLAVLARHHRIPFYVAAPGSTFDLRAKTARDIEIEQRSGDEVTTLYFKKPVAASGVAVYNPAFDVTPHGLITAIITDLGIVRPPYSRTIAAVLKKARG
ncbi:MAG TPA: S-methyl-5-thioribose-1-phosphate isomerase [Candidatus Omnitrophota bacterium]|nr:S-methyl-5-thioribose-1-phosphate isomerase [Candidatus Omnitrophota bacterium]HQJ15327.1 S-methyl-5-thioribose-1-phosphate isomerase [Candidatus Omnitrophota bacterium]